MLTRTHRWTHRIRALTAAASTVALCGLPLLSAAPASAAPLPTAPPAPSCVALYESWRYVTASNDCATAHQVQVVYQDGATGLCHALAPGTQTTVGEGYFGGTATSTTWPCANRTRRRPGPEADGRSYHDRRRTTLTCSLPITKLRASLCIDVKRDADGTGR